MSKRYDLRDPEEAEKGIAAAVTALRAGELVVMPTDTVYGVAADAFDLAAVSRLQQAKGRGRDSPPPVLVGSVAALDGLADDIDHNARDLVRTFWPGGLSIVLSQQPSLTWDLGDTKGTVMLRMPDHDQALQLLRRTGPLAVSSANKHGRPPATSVDIAEAELGEEIAVYLDGGDTPGPSPSTIVDMTRVVPQLLRRGVITEEQLREVLSLLEVDIDGEPVFGEEDDESDAEQEAIEGWTHEDDEADQDDEDADRELADAKLADDELADDERADEERAEDERDEDAEEQAPDQEPTGETGPTESTEPTGPTEPTEPTHTDDDDFGPGSDDHWTDGDVELDEAELADEADRDGELADEADRDDDWEDSREAPAEDAANPVDAEAADTDEQTLESTADSAADPAPHPVDAESVDAESADAESAEADRSERDRASDA